MELEDKENGDVIEGEDQLGWSFFSLWTEKNKIKVPKNTRRKTLSKRNN